MELIKATTGERFLAFIIDGIICGLISFGFRVIHLTPLGGLASLAYFLLKDSIGFLNGQSIGKKAMKIQVVKLNGDSIKDDLGAGVIRNLSLIIPLFNIIDAFMVTGKDGLRYGDKWADTQVVRV